MDELHCAIAHTRRDERVEIVTSFEQADAPANWSWLLISRSWNQTQLGLLSTAEPYTRRS